MSNDSYLHLHIDARVWSTTKSLVVDFDQIHESATVVVGVARHFHWRNLPAAVHAERLLDTHWIVHVAYDDRSRRLAEASLFDLIADRYDLEVDPQRNRANVQLLLDLVGAHPGDRILDFGCGPGLTRDSVSQIGLVGCDVSAAMRAKARAHGLCVVEPHELADLENSVDGMIASYVLHLAVPAPDLLAAVRCVRLGGRVAANFHKSRGVDEAALVLAQQGGLAEITEARRDDTRHGPLRLWQRVG